MTQKSDKKTVAVDALAYVKPGMVIGVGTGSTVNYFIDALAKENLQLEGAVASSAETQARLKKIGVPIMVLNDVANIPVYIDGADEVTPQGYMIKGGGGALTQEKIVASACEKFICIVDASKQVAVLGDFPVAVEVIPMARSFVAREILKIGGNPVYRLGTTTDNGNVILDVHQLNLLDPLTVEQQLNNIPGVVENGIFANRLADTILTPSQKIET